MAGTPLRLLSVRPLAERPQLTLQTLRRSSDAAVSAPDIAGLLGLTICIAGFAGLAIAAVAIAFPKKPSGFATPADERDATDAVNRNRPQAKRPISVN